MIIYREVQVNDHHITLMYRFTVYQQHFHINLVVISQFWQYMNSIVFLNREVFHGITGSYESSVANISNTFCFWNCVSCCNQCNHVSGPSLDCPPLSLVSWRWQFPWAKEQETGPEHSPELWLFCSKTVCLSGLPLSDQSSRLSSSHSMSAKIGEWMSTKVAKAHHTLRQDLFCRRISFFIK